MILRHTAQADALRGRRGDKTRDALRTFGRSLALKVDHTVLQRAKAAPAQIAIQQSPEVPEMEVQQPPEIQSTTENGIAMDPPGFIMVDILIYFFMVDHDEFSTQSSVSHAILVEFGGIP